MIKAEDIKGVAHMDKVKSYTRMVGEDADESTIHFLNKLSTFHNMTEAEAMIWVIGLVSHAALELMMCRYNYIHRFQAIWRLQTVLL